MEPQRPGGTPSNRRSWHEGASSQRPIAAVIREIWTPALLRGTPCDVRVDAVVTVLVGDEQTRCAALRRFPTAATMALVMGWGRRRHLRQRLRAAGHGRAPFTWSH